MNIADIIICVNFICIFITLLQNRHSETKKMGAVVTNRLIDVAIAVIEIAARLQLDVQAVRSKGLLVFFPQTKIVQRHILAQFTIVQ
jgi:hypothetical protein